MLRHGQKEEKEMKYLLIIIAVLFMAVPAIAGTHTCTRAGSGLHDCESYICTWDTSADGTVPDVSIGRSGAIVQVNTKPNGTVTSYNLTFTDDYGYEILENNLDNRSATASEEVEFAPVEIYTGRLTISNSDTATNESGNYKFILCH